LFPIKDYYQILKVHKNAKAEDIKKSYRALAHTYHPDKNQGNEIVSSYFIEIQEAYSVLSNPISKRVYDRERSRTGQGSYSGQMPISAASIQKELNQLTSIIHVSRGISINKELIVHYLKFLFSTNNMAIILSENSKGHLNAFFQQVLKIAGFLELEFFSQIIPELTLLANQDKHLLQLIDEAMINKKKQHLWRVVLPVFIAVITMVLCFIMYLYAKS